MTQRRRSLLQAGGIASLGTAMPALLAGCAAPPVRAPTTRQELEAQVDEHARTAGGTVGVALHHAPSGTTLNLNAELRYAMASVFKLPLALALLAQVDARKLSLEQRLPVTPDDRRPGSGSLAHANPLPTAVPVRELLEAMMIHSDNTATDLLWSLVGGAPAVQGRLAALGHGGGISVDRPTAGIIAGVLGVDQRRGSEPLTPQRLAELMRDTPRPERQAAMSRFYAERLDTATPAAVLALLDAVWRGRTLGADSTRLLVDIMKRCETGRRRIKGGLPAGTVVAHKTGTLQPGTTNDAGGIWLPGGGVLLLVVMIKRSPLPLQAQERVIADIAGAAYHHFTLLAHRAG